MRVLASIGFVLLLFASSASSAPLSLYDRIAAKLAHDSKLAAAVGRPAPELKSVRWMLGTWDVTARVFATPLQKEQVSHGRSVIAEALGGTWLSQTDSYDGVAQDQGWLTYNPVLRKWISVSVDATGNSVVTRADGWRDNRLVFSGDVEIVGVKATLRQTLEKRGPDTFVLHNEERLSSGTWVPLDEYVLTRTSRSLRPQTPGSRRP